MLKCKAENGYPENFKSGVREVLVIINVRILEELENHSLTDFLQDVCLYVSHIFSRPIDYLF